MTCNSICDSCDTVRHCSKYGCVPATHPEYIEGLVAAAAMGVPQAFPPPPPPPKGKTMINQAYTPQAERAAQAWRDAQDEKVRAAKRHDGLAAQTSAPADQTIVEREFARLQDALVSLNLTINEHAGRLAPVLLPTASAQGKNAEAPDEGLGRVGNGLRQARQSIERLQRQLADLRFRLTI